VAILAGIVSIINGCRQWHLKKRQKQWDSRPPASPYRAQSLPEP
jgi:hypothetical protein